MKLLLVVLIGMPCLVVFIRYAGKVIQQMPLEPPEGFWTEKETVRWITPKSSKKEQS